MTHQRFGVAVLFWAGAALCAQNGSLSVNGGHQYVSTLDSPALAPTPHFTIEAWIKPTVGATGFNYTILRKPESPPSYLLRIASNGTAEFLAFVNGGTHSTVAVTGPLAGAWHHLAGVYDGAMLRLYLDGLQIQATPLVGSAVSIAGPLRIGDGASNESASFVGLIDEVRIWNFARSSAAIQAERFLSVDFAPGLVSCWKFDGNYADTAGPHEGTPVGGASLSTEGAPVAGAALDWPQTVGIGVPCAWGISTVSPGDYYLFDLSLTGSTPGVLVAPNIVVPLNQPWLRLQLGASLPPGFFVDFDGVLGAEPAFPYFTIPALPALAGTALTSSFTLLDPTTFAVKAVSPARTTTLSASAPVIGTVAPTTILDSTGGTLTVSGTGFTPGAVVEFEGIALMTTFLSSSSLTAPLPAGTPGAKMVGVRNPNGSEAFLPGGIVYIETLRVQQVTPNSPAAGQPVTVVGTGFVPGTTFTVAGLPVVATINSSSDATFLAPSGVPCSAPVVAVNPDGQTAARAWNTPPFIGYAYYAQSPASGGGTFVLLGDFPAGSQISVGGAPAIVLAMTESSAVAIAPPGVPGASTLVVTGPNNCGASVPFLYY